MEGVAYALNDSLQIFGELGIPITQVRVGGGGAKSAVWRQIHADVTGQAHVTLAVDEGPAFGAALLAAVGVGAYPSVADACAAAVQTAAVTEPDPAAHAKYAEYYSVYQSLYPALKDQFAAVSNL